MKDGVFFVEADPRKIEAARTAQGLSKRAVAFAAGCTPAYMTLIEQGKQHTVANTKAEGIAAALKQAPECLFPGFVEAKTAAKKTAERRTMTDKEKEAAAYEYIGFAKHVAWEHQHLLGEGRNDAEEAISIALVAFAEALNTFDPQSGSNFKTYVAYAIKNRLKSEFRRIISSKRKGYTFSLDAPMYDDSDESVYSFIPAGGYSPEERFFMLEECREVVRGLTQRQRNDRRIQDLLLCVGL